MKLWQNVVLPTWRGPLKKTILFFKSFATKSWIYHSFKRGKRFVDIYPHYTRAMWIDVHTTYKRHGLGGKFPCFELIVLRPHSKLPEEPFLDAFELWATKKPNGIKLL
jgi:hypothetical protein